MTVGSGTEGADGDGALSKRPFSLLAPLVVIHVCLLSVAFLYDTGTTATAAIGLWVVTYFAIPIIGYLDLRRVRNTGHWTPRLRGGLWIVGLSIPLVSPSIAVAYLFRRREMVTYDGSWGGWPYVMGGSLAIIFVSLLLTALFEDPSVDGNTAVQNAGIFLFIAATPLPGVATYFDLKHLHRVWGQRRALYHWLWVPAMGFWFAQFLFFIGYVVWRRKVLNNKERLEAAESALEAARSHLESGTSAFRDGQYESALSSYDRARTAIEGSRNAVEDVHPGDDSKRPQRFAEVGSELEHMATAIDARRNHAEAEQLVDRGKTALEDDKLESARDTFQSAIERCEDAETLSDGDDHHESILDTLERARECRQSARERIVANELQPVAERIRSAYDTAAEALESGDYDTAADQLETAKEHVQAFDSRASSYDLSRNPPVSAADIEDRLKTVERQRAVAEEVDPLAERIESTYADGIDALENEQYDVASDRFDGLESRIDRFSSLVDEYDLDRDPPVTRDEVAAAEQRVRRGRHRSRIESQLELVSEHRRTGEASMSEGEYDEAVDAFETAREHLDTATSLIDEAADEAVDADWGVADRRSSLDGLYGAAVQQRQEQRYRDPLERGDERREAAADAVDENRYGDAFEAFESARDDYEQAARVARTSEIGDVETVEQRLTEVTELHADYRVQELSDRITDARVNADTEDRDRCLAAADALADIVAELDEVDVDRDRDLEILREEARRELVKAKLLAERSRARKAADAFKAAEYATARDRFEATAAAASELQTEAEGMDVSQYDDAIQGIVSTCEQNADAARRGVLGIADDPTLDPVELPLEANEDGDRHPADASARPRPRSDGSVDVPEASDTRLDGSIGEELPQYEEVGHIGSGGNADVYEVRLDSGERAALKVPRWQGTISKSLVAEFASEADTWGKLDEHEHIVPLLGWGEQPYPWMLLELLPASLADRMDDLSTAEALHVLVDVADALEFAHGRGVVHLDIKPENVLLTADGSPKVGDWGLSQVVLEHSQTQMGLTPPYSAPEQLTDTYGDIDRQTDVYQLSVLAYRMLTGRLPFVADRPADLQRQILKTDPEPPSALNPSLDSATDDILLRGLAKDPSERYEAVVLLRNELGSLST